MKKTILINFLILVASISYTYAQNINWQSFTQEQTRLAYVNFGYDFGMTTQVGYGYKIAPDSPFLLTADFSFPKGTDWFDDFKIRLGGQMSVIEKGHFILTAKAYGQFRRHETELVRMASFGANTAILAGHYTSKWHLAGEFGFDKSINTHLKHSDLIRDHYPAITDGWFVPSGGHFFYGIQASKTLGKKIDLSINLGATNAQSDNENALLPYYAQLGLVWKIRSKKGYN